VLILSLNFRIKCLLDFAKVFILLLALSNTLLLGFSLGSSWRQCKVKSLILFWKSTDPFDLFLKGRRCLSEIAALDYSGLSVLIHLTFQKFD
jgi:hypothetical protein